MISRTFISLFLFVAVLFAGGASAVNCNWNWGQGIQGNSCSPDDYSGGEIYSDGGCSEAAEAGNKLILCQGVGGSKAYTYTCICAPY